MQRRALDRMSALAGGPTADHEKGKTLVDPVVEGTAAVEYGEHIYGYRDILRTWSQERVGRLWPM